MGSVQPGSMAPAGRAVGLAVSHNLSELALNP